MRHIIEQPRQGKIVTQLEDRGSAEEQDLGGDEDAEVRSISAVVGVAIERGGGPESEAGGEDQTGPGERAKLLPRVVARAHEGVDWR